MMGAYLSEPVTTKISKDDTITIDSKKCQYATTAVQGWRVGMEDCLLVLPDFSEDSILLGVFDGHGGREVAEYCTRHMERFIKDSKSYKDASDIHKALEDAFLNCDRALLEEDAQKELKEIIQESLKEEEGDCTLDDLESEEDISKLEEEATMPLEQLLNGKVDAKDLVKGLAQLANKDMKKHKPGDPSASSSSGSHGHGMFEKYIQKMIPNPGLLTSHLLSLISDGTSESDDESEEEIEDEEESNEEETEMGEGGEATVTHGAGSSREVEGGGESKSGADGATNEPAQGESQRNQRKRKRDLQKESQAKRQHGEDEVPNDMEGYECGTTAVVCLVKGQQVIVANAGDSRCVLSRNGKAINLSEDHKPTDPIEQTRIEKAGGCIDQDLRVNGGLNLSRAIGDHLYKQTPGLPLEDQMISSQPDLLTTTITGNDEFVLLASDGIWNCTTSQDVVDFIRQRLINLKEGKPISDQNKDKEQTPSLICEELCDMCLAPNTDNDGSGCDNMTVILLLLKPLSSF